MSRNLDKQEKYEVNSGNASYEKCRQYLEDMKGWENEDNEAIQNRTADNDQISRVELRKQINEILTKEQKKEDTNDHTGETKNTDTESKAIVKELTEEEVKERNKLEELLKARLEKNDRYVDINIAIDTQKTKIKNYTAQRNKDIALLEKQKSSIKNEIKDTLLIEYMKNNTK